MHGYLHNNMKKVKNEYLGQYVTRYNPLGFETSFYVTEETAQQAEYLTSVGLGYLFEEAEQIGRASCRERVLLVV